MTGRGVDLFWRVLAVALLMVMGMMVFRTEPNAKASELMQPNGRYQFVANPGGSVIFDTNTGKIFNVVPEIYIGLKGLYGGEFFLWTDPVNGEMGKKKLTRAN